MIIDSTVILSLGKLRCLDLIGDFILPENVFNEILDEPVKTAMLKLKHKKITPLKQSRDKAMELLGDSKESGDSDIVALILENPNSIIATDDRRLRNICKVLGGKITGTLGIIINSVKLKNISKERAIELVENLDSIGFRMSVQLFKTVLNEINKL